MNNSESIIQWNTQGISTSKQDILKLIEQHKPAVLAIQETQLGNDFMIRLPAYNGLCKQGNYNRRFHGGVAMYIHSNIPFMEVKIDTNYQILAVTLSLGPLRNLTVLNAYVPGSVELDKNEFNRILRALPKPYLLMGDLNGHNPLWGPDERDARGRIIEEIIQEESLTVMNTGVATHISGTAVDVTLATADVTAEVTWNAQESVYSSDHYPIVVEVLGNARPTMDAASSYNYDKADWLGYHADESWQALPEIGTQHSTRFLVRDMYERLYQAADRNIPTFVYRRYYPRSWWNDECKRAWKRREAAYRRYKNTGSMESKVQWKKLRAIAKVTFKRAKQQDMRKYVESMKVNAPMASIYEKLRKIRGRPPKKISILVTNNEQFTTIPEIANRLAASFAEVASKNNYSAQFAAYSKVEEKNALNFEDNVGEQYNLPFTVEELEEVIRTAGNTSCGPDRIHYKMIKRLPKNATNHLLAIYNRIWTGNYFPEEWKEAIVIPIPKPQKDHTNPLNYRPIALTSCLCKVLEKIINNRLMEYLEGKKILSSVQCGFRKGRATIDHLVRLETYIRQNMAEGRATVAVFFDLQKAYDTTWRYGIMRDVHRVGVRGNMARFLERFMNERTFRVRMNNVISDQYKQECGVPQGSILSVTLFALKINSLSDVIPRNIMTSLYVDDLQIAYSDTRMEDIEGRLQRAIVDIVKWADFNGCKFSNDKTVSMIFHGREAPMRIPRLVLKNTEIKRVDKVKFLGLWWDPKLSWKTHVAQLRADCGRRLNIMKALSTPEWGACQEMQMRIYRLLIRPKLDYGCIVYSSAGEGTLGALDFIQNEAMRISSGAFRTTPINSLQVLCNEPHLSFRRMDLAVRYYFKNKAHIINPAYSSIVNTNLEMFFESRPAVIPSVIMRIKQALITLRLPTQPVITYKTPTVYSWVKKRAKVDLEMVKDREVIKACPNVRQYVNNYLHEEYAEFRWVFTDGSKTGDKVGAAMVTRVNKRTVCLPGVATVLSAELHAISLACQYAEERGKGKYLVCSDSLSSIRAIQQTDTRNILVGRIQEKIHWLMERGREIVLLWVPGHAGIELNEQADKAAKEAARRGAEFICIPHSDWIPRIKKEIYRCWEEKWKESRAKLYQIKEKPGTWPKIVMTRKDEVVINRLRLGHTRMTHKYIVDGQVEGNLPVCESCQDAVLTVEHVLIRCEQLREARQTHLLPYYDRLSVGEVLNEKDSGERVITYLKCIGCYSKI